MTTPTAMAARTLRRSSTRRRRRPARVRARCRCGRRWRPRRLGTGDGRARASSARCRRRPVPSSPASGRWPARSTSVRCSTCCMPATRIVLAPRRRRAGHADLPRLAPGAACDRALRHLASGRAPPCRRTCSGAAARVRPAGHRLGYGGGYYDRTLAGLPGATPSAAPSPPRSRVAPGRLTRNRADLARLPPRPASASFEPSEDVRGMNPMRICFSATWSAAPAAKAPRLAAGLRAALRIDLAIVNAENASHGFGLAPDMAQALFAAGADVITLGNHAWDRKEIIPYIARAAAADPPAELPARHARRRARDGGRSPTAAARRGSTRWAGCSWTRSTARSAAPRGARPLQARQHACRHRARLPRRGDEREDGLCALASTAR